MKDYSNITREFVMSLSTADRNHLCNKLSQKLDSIMYEDPNNEWDRVYCAYNIVNAVIDDIYREENIDKFREYEAKMNEPDFDWGFYSDWHKDMFGYRPHKRVIPKDEAERHQI